MKRKVEEMDDRAISSLNTFLSCHENFIYKKGKVMAVSNIDFYCTVREQLYLQHPTKIEDDNKCCI